MIGEKARQKIAELFILFIIGGIVYVLIELAWRGHSHPSMFVVGGLCFVVIGSLNNCFPWDLGVVQQTAIAVVVIKTLELVAGLIVNVWLGLGVWDYSHLPFNLWGQISLYFTLLWIPLAVFAIFLDDWLRYWLFSEERPRYTLI